MGHRNFSPEDQILLTGTSVPFITIVKNDNKNRLEIHLRGEFPPPEFVSTELIEIDNLSSRYSTCVVYISSGGGVVSTFCDIHAVLQKFETIITVVMSHAASAGLTLWAAGDIRVANPSAELMAHRESSGTFGRTDNMHDYTSFLRRRFDALFSEQCSEILTEEEIERARLSDVWFLGQDFIDRGTAISWDDFLMGDEIPFPQMNVIELDGKHYVAATDGNYFEAELTINTDAPVSAHFLRYGVVPSNWGLGDQEEEDQEPSLEKLSNGNDFISFDEIREVLNNEVGRGNYSISSLGKVVIIYHGKEYEILGLPGATEALHDKKAFFSALEQFHKDITKE